ncbi:family 10 glycosylhydrolase [Paenibacillus sp. MBLB4367]|uniref:family 10 glycosylhydrolase n=1 Tax=Paenibacillus sp. MBLB4367 TaxID=3384767 RepID=UPI0039082865
MRFRQIHLDFHNHANVPIGTRFSKRQFQEMLQLGNVDSITVFAKCFHGWAYYDTKKFDKHPGLQFDLLAEMIEAAHEIGVKTPVYINVGLDEQLARRHPEWLMRDELDRTTWDAGFKEPGFHVFCFHSPYLEHIVQQIEEVVHGYDADGIFLDIVYPKACYCHNCRATLLAEGKDPHDEKAVMELAERVYANYTAQVNERVRAIKPDMAVFHNSGIRCGRRDIAAMNSHLEVESLPSGGWGYDYFPISARYLQQIEKHIVGMTGRFNKNWGEFGGYKHPNAFRFEAALSLAHGTRCSVGDHLHPDGVMDPIVYKSVGGAYREVEAKEPWCAGVENVADVAVLAVESLGPAEERMGRSDIGAYRILQEGNVLFDFIDTDSDFAAYKVVILPDKVRITPKLAVKLERFFENGGKVLATGESGLNEAGDAFAIDLGASWIGANPFQPDFFRPHFATRSLGEGSFVFYAQGQKVALGAGGTELGVREDPYFNRGANAYYFTHTPNCRNDAGPGMVESANGIYLAWNAFLDYGENASLFVKETILHALDLLLGAGKTLETSLPAQGIVSLQHQPHESRYVNHLLYAFPVKRGKEMEIIEDITPIYDIDVTLNIAGRVNRVYLAPQLEELPYEQEGATIRYKVPVIDCHQMVVIDCQ